MPVRIRPGQQLARPVGRRVGARQHEAHARARTACSRAATRLRWPTRLVNRLEMTAVIAASAGPGASWRPARRIDSSQTPVWKSTLESSIAPNAAENRIAATLAIENERTRSIAGSTIGEGWRAQRTANSARPAAAPASAPSVRGSSQPQSGACTKPERERADGRGEQRGAEPVGAPLRGPGRASRSAAATPRHSAHAPTGRFTRNTSRQSDLHQQPAERRAGRGGGGADARPDADRRRAVARLELGQQQRERGRDEQRRAGRLQDARGDERRHRRREPAQRRAERRTARGRRGSRGGGRPVGQPPGGDEQGGEHDRVGVEHPRQRADARAAEVGRGCPGTRC